MIVFGTPAYFYSCTGQLKVLFDRTVAIYPDLPNKQYYYLLAQGDESKDTFAGTIKSLDGFLDCYEGSKLKGMVAPRIAPAYGSSLRSGYQEIRIIRKSSFGQSVIILIVCDDRRDFIG